MQAQPNLIGTFLPFILLFAIFYFLIIRPQQKQQKAHQEMVDGLQKGDKIITNGGLIVTVLKTEADFLKVKLNDDTIVKLDRAFVSKKVDSSNENA
jgi:preprotein translocase subunit YajC